jgi:hypothetical protein
VAICDDAAAMMEHSSVDKMPNIFKDRTGQARVYLFFNLITLTMLRIVRAKDYFIADSLSYKILAILTKLK